MASSFTYIQVEPNDNCPMSASQVFKNLDAPFRVSQVRLYEGQPGGELYAIAGWWSANGGTPSNAYAVRVEDSSAGSAYVVYGGDCGVRLRPITSNAEWSLDAPDQYGETHLVLSDRDDLIE
jgi:hypothetical protein